MKTLLLTVCSIVLVSSSAYALSSKDFIRDADYVHKTLGDALRDAKGVSAEIENGTYTYEVDFISAESCMATERNLRQEKLADNVVIEYDCMDSTPSIELKRPQ